MKSNPALSAIPVIDQSLAGADSDEYDFYSATLGYADYANIHVYSNNARPGAVTAGI